jgi:hypothetical protein
MPQSRKENRGGAHLLYFDTFTVLLYLPREEKTPVRSAREKSKRNGRFLYRRKE